MIIIHVKCFGITLQAPITNYAQKIA